VKSIERPTRETIRAELRDLMAELQRMRDEIRLKVNLASKEVRETWEEKAEPRFRELERRVATVTETTAHELREAARDLRTHFRRIRDQLQPD
jgi:hypothetical protein